MTKKAREAETEFEPYLIDVPTVVVEMDTLHEDPANARSHPKKNLEAIRASLLTFGQVEALVVQKSTNKIIGGNGRYAVMRQLGWTKAKVAIVDVNDTQATALGIALNRTGDLAEWHDETLSSLLEHLESQGIDAFKVGFDEKDLKKLRKKLEADDGFEDNKPQLDNVKYCVIVEFNDEMEQVEMVKRLEGEGHRCRMLIS